METKISDRNLKRWIRTSVYTVFSFRSLFDKAQKTEDSGQKNYLQQKILHVNKKIEGLRKRGIILGLSEDQIRSVNADIVEKIKRGQKPENIIDYLEQRGIK